MYEFMFYYAKINNFKQGAFVWIILFTPYGESNDLVSKSK